MTSNPQQPKFSTEATLVDSFISSLEAGSTTFGDLQITTEWDHRSGFVDVLVRDAANRLIAFEAKLRDWRRALLQAYRNTAYADRAYILLPPRAAERAFLHRDEFERRGIGLCSLDGEKIQVLIESHQHDALLKWVRSRAHDFFDSKADDERPAGRPSDCVPGLC